MTTKTRTQPADSTLGPLPVPTRLLALDVSSSAVGWAVFDIERDGPHFHVAGVIRDPSRSSEARIERHTRRLGDLAADRGVDRVIMEWQSAWKAARCRNATGLAILGQAQGAAFWELRRRGIPVDTVSERAWTRVGGWPASKEKRAARVMLLCSEYRDAVAENPKLDTGLDLADALGLAYWRMSR